MRTHNSEHDNEREDALSLHPDWDIDLEPREGEVNEQLKALVQQSVRSTLQQRKKALAKYPLPSLAEFKPPSLT